MDAVTTRASCGSHQGRPSDRGERAAIVADEPLQSGFCIAKRKSYCTVFFKKTFEHVASDVWMANKSPDSLIDL